MSQRAFFAALFLCAPHLAHAFCGFYVGGVSAKMYNNATQVVLLRDGTRTVLSMENNYQGPAEGFALVIPVPIVLQKENVKTLPKEVFERVDLLDSPRLVEYWEQNPCPEPVPYDMYPQPTPSAAPRGELDDLLGGKDNSPKVKIEAQFSVEEYEIVILSASESTALETWLTDNKYNIPKGAAAVLKPYVEGGQKFFVAKVDPKKVTFKDGQAKLSPLRFHYDSETFMLPIRLGMLNAKDKQDLIVHILAKDRYETANYKNVFIPTNLEMTDGVRDEFAAVYAALFDKAIEKNPKSVVTEYSWQASNCDPCPVSPISDQDAVTLGADILPAFKGYQWGYSNALTLTRLHTRYAKGDIAEDLVFQVANPVVGGREEYEYNEKTGEEKVKNRNDAYDDGGGVNNFQARYIIRHPWKGPIKCENPQRGIWGGPPEDPYGGWDPVPAKDLAFAPRGSVSLPKSLKQDVPELGIKYKRKFFGKKKTTPTPTPAPTEPAAPQKKPSFMEPQGSKMTLPWGAGFSLFGGLLIVGAALTSRKKK